MAGCGHDAAAPLLDAATDDALMRAALESSVVGVAITTAEGRFAYVNPALCQLLGYGKEELTNRRFAELTHPDDVAASLQRRLAQLKSGEISGFTMRKRYLTATGETVWADLSVAAVRSTDAEQCNYVAQMVNVTAEVAAARNRADDGEELRQVAQHATDLVLVVNAAGRLTWVSDGAIAYLGRGPQELVGTGLLDLVVDASPTQAADLHELLVRGEVVRDQPTNLRHANGQVVTMRARVSPTFDRAGALTGAVIGLADDREEAATQATLSQGDPCCASAPTAETPTMTSRWPRCSSADAFWLEDTLRRITELAVELSDADFRRHGGSRFRRRCRQADPRRAQCRGSGTHRTAAPGAQVACDSRRYRVPTHRARRRAPRAPRLPAASSADRDHSGGAGGSPWPHLRPSCCWGQARRFLHRGRSATRGAARRGGRHRHPQRGTAASGAAHAATAGDGQRHPHQRPRRGTEAELARIVVERLHALVACDTVVVMTGPHSRRPDRVLAVSPTARPSRQVPWWRWTRRSPDCSPLVGRRAAAVR